MESIPDNCQWTKIYDWIGIPPSGKPATSLLSRPSIKATPHDLVLYSKIGTYLSLHHRSYFLW